MRLVFFVPFSLAVLGACQELEPLQGAPQVSEPAAAVQRTGRAQTVADFRAVVGVMEPIAERVCRAETRNRDCDFDVRVDPDPNLAPNAFQTLDETGRPVIVFTATLIAETLNRDEIAFIFSHEAAHHIEGHIPKTQQSAMTGAVLAGILASAVGLETQGVDAATRVGATVGTLRFSKEFELQADALGTIITARGGFDPVRGAAYFGAVPDPGDSFLATHPPNAERVRTVERVAAGL